MSETATTLPIPSTKAVGRNGAATLIPGLALAALLGGGAFALSRLSGIAAASPLITAIIIGMLVRNTIGVPAACQPGLAFAVRPVLRFAIILLGLQLAPGDILAVGPTGLAILVATLVSTYAFTVWCGRRLGVEASLARLIAAGTSICGASAVAATSAATGARDEDVTYAIACVTIFGSLAMLLYPLLPGLLAMGPNAYGLWAGASIHEVAQVVAAAFQHGAAAGETATIAKLTRVLMLAPMVLAIGFQARLTNRAAGRAKTPLPLFVFGFVALVVLNGFVEIPEAVTKPVATLTSVLMALALAAMGLDTDIRRLSGRGLRPLALGAASALFIALFSLALIEFFA